MRFKGVYQPNGAGELSLGSFYLTDVRKLVNIIRLDGRECSRNDHIGDYRDYYNRRVRSRNSVFLAFRAERKVLGYVAFDPYNSHAGGLHVWLKTDASPDTMRRGGILVLRYAFEELRLHKILTTVLLNNTKMLHFAKSLGFQVEGVMRQNRQVDGQLYDEALLGLLKEEFDE